MLETEITVSLEQTGLFEEELGRATNSSGEIENLKPLGTSMVELHEIA